jgi:hypothetical protein
MKLLKKIILILIFSFDFFFKLKKKDNLFVSFPRSGTFLTIAMINICYSMQRGLGKNFSIADDGYRTFDNLAYPFDERSIFVNNKNTFPKIENDKVLWHSHMPYNKIVPLRKKYCKIVVLVREPVENIKSNLIRLLRQEKKNFGNKISFEEFKRLDKKYDLLTYFNNYCESWFKLKQKNKISKPLNELFIFNLKTIQKNKKSYLKFLNNFYNFNFNDEQINYATEQLDLENVKKKLSANTIRITNADVDFSQDIDEFINLKCSNSYEKIMKFSDDKILEKNV